MKKGKDALATPKDKLGTILLSIYAIILISILLKNQIPDSTLLTNYVNWLLGPMSLISIFLTFSGIFIHTKDRRRGKKLILQGLTGLCASGLIYAIFFSPVCCTIINPGF